MTDNEIIKALECLRGNAFDCGECPYCSCYPAPCEQQIAKDALSLINRQKEEIKGLRDEIEHLHEVIDDLYETIEGAGRLPRLCLSETQIMNTTGAFSSSKWAETISIPTF